MRSYMITRYVRNSLRGRELQTATEIHSYIMLNYASMPSKPTASLATVSSILHKLVKGGLAMRLKGFGPRGGYGYVSTRKERKSH